ncbi:MAG: 1-deoxy-D-xylulose-5-phosphate synthase [Betaproteobacteria bacterium]|nr:1-deoxy-D-xylulose-5-phosphate synthase [Betaproteobacteria bacterium]NBY13626.1 1-deoxy-D-xylulose-5-phosphate synthase [Betaproteobacteria bacterium]
MGLLSDIQSPQDLRLLSRRQLKDLSEELREFLLHSVAGTGGHLSSNLGTVELTVAIHTVFQTPFDRLIWDVGHQSYPHKILTGRRDQMATLRQLDGISGFPRRCESEYDHFGTAHSSTSISAALGMALASRQKGEHRGPNRRRHVAVIGDGAMSAGMAFEAMNNAGIHKDIDLLVILNDNEMSISPPVGAMANYLARLMTGRFYSAARELGKQVLSAVPPMLDIAKRLEGGAKSLVGSNTLFEEFGFNYFGPIDGHDLDALIPALQNLRELKGPQFLHVITKKGQGYARAEEDPITYHGPGKFDPAVGLKPPSAAPKPTYSTVFGDWLCDAATADDRVVGITPAMREGSGMVEFSQRFPSRYHDVAIAEQHAVTVAAGMACEGLRPVVAIYSTFLQRGYDQLIHDVALQNLPVLFAIDRAGLVGADGATHAGAFDMAFLRCVPNMVVMAPKDEPECRAMLSTGLHIDGPSAVRYPRGAGMGIPAGTSLEPLEVGRAERLREGSVGPHGLRVALLAFGSMVGPALKAAESLHATVVNMRFVKPLDHDMIVEISHRHDLLVTIEEHVISGGAGSAVAEALVALGDAVPMIPIYHLGLPDHFIDHGDHAALLAREGLDALGIEASVRYRAGLIAAQSSEQASRENSQKTVAVR